VQVKTQIDKVELKGPSLKGSTIDPAHHVKQLQHRTTSTYSFHLIWPTSVAWLADWPTRACCFVVIGRPHIPQPLSIAAKKISSSATLGGRFLLLRNWPAQYPEEYLYTSMDASYVAQNGICKIMVW